MRYCLSCRHLASSGPICSQCGRSFGGHLCDAGHLNPPGAQFCAQCGSTKLLQSASSIAVGRVLGLAVLTGALWLGCRALPELHWGETLRHQLALVYAWLLWKLVVFGFLAGLAWLFGDLFSLRIRRGVERVVGSLFLLLFRIIESILTALFRALAYVVGDRTSK